MPAFNRKFDLDTTDMELIEASLHETIRELSTNQLGRAACDKTKERLRRTKDLLGRLHNQKVFYRPTNQPYVGG